MKTMLVLMLLALPCYADDGRTSVLPAHLHDPNGTVACQATVEHVTAGERLCVRAWAPMTSDAGVGATMQLASCAPLCSFTVLRTAPNWSEYETGNVTREMHHKTFRASAEYVATEDLDALTFQARVHVYASRPKGRWLRVDRCAVRVVRSTEACQ